MKSRYFNSLSVLLLSAVAGIAQAQIGVSISVDLAPPALPVYDQPAIPGDGYMWTPGYWGWNASDNDYFWVPGTWVNAPYAGALWTPGYWGMEGNRYRWNQGYWGDHTGYYGGINYGFGYAGVGYQGGYWDHGAFNYNRSVNNVNNVHISNAYTARITGAQNSRVSFNGGRGGVQMTATKNEQIINSMPHNHGTEQQMQHETMAGKQTGQRMSANHGVPTVAATPEAGLFNSNRNEAGRAEQRPAARSQQRAPEQRPAVQQRPPEQRQPEQEHGAQRATEPRQAARPAPAARPEGHPAPEHEEHK